jgi:prepilin-type N-terminal cleavage/methylation domain-containing protein
MNRKRYKKNISGFTLTEIIVVIMVISAMAALALPHYRVQMLTIRNQEATQILFALYNAQMDYNREIGSFFAGNRAAINANLDIDIPPLKNFNTLEALDGTLALCGGPGSVGRATSNFDNYRLNVVTDGSIVCEWGGVCNIAICRKFGL